MHLTPLEEEILRAILEHGDSPPSYIAKKIDGNSKSVSRSLGSLEDKQLVENKDGSGTWKLTKYGVAVVRDL